MDAFDDSSAPPPAPASDESPSSPFEQVENGEVAADPVTVGEGQDVTQAVLGAADSLEGLSLRQNAPSPSVPREEPETIKQWRVDQEKRLEEKDANEAKMMEELRQKGKKELQDWYKKYNEQLDKTKEDNRTSEKTFVAEMDAIEPGTEWERVSKLCEFNAKKQNSSKDMSRMRSILLQLKQDPKPVIAAK